MNSHGRIEQDSSSFEIGKLDALLEKVETTTLMVAKRDTFDTINGALRLMMNQEKAVRRSTITINKITAASTKLLHDGLPYTSSQIYVQVGKTTIIFIVNL